MNDVRKLLCCLLLSVSAVAAGQVLLPPDGRSAAAPETTQIMNGAAGQAVSAAAIDRSVADRRCRPEDGREKISGGSLISLDPVALWHGHRDDLLLLGLVVLLLAGIFGGYTLAVRRAARRAMRFYRALPGRIGVCGRRGEILFSQSDGRVEDYRRIEELPDVDAVKFRAAVDAVLADGRERTIDYECNGVKRSVTFSPLDAGLFGENSVIWSANDNTELQDARRKAEELTAQLRKNTRMWDIVINSLPICIYAKDVDNNYRYVFANRNTHSFFRRSEGGVVGSDDFQIFPKNVASALRRDDEEAMTSPGAALEKMFRFRRDDGAPVVCKIIRRPFLDCDGTRLLLGAAIDVSELEAAIQSAQDSSERFQLILRSIGDAVIATDRDGRITVMNSAAEELVGCRMGDVKGTAADSILRLVDHENDSPLPSPVSTALKSGAAAETKFDGDLISLDGHRRRVSCGAAPIRDKAGVMLGVILVCRHLPDSGGCDSERLKRLFDYCADFTRTATIEYNIDTGEITGSKLFPEMWAFEDGVPVPWNRWIFKEDIELFGGQFSRLLSGQADQVSIVYRSDYNGELRYFRSIGSVDRSRPSKAMMVFGAIQEVTEVIRGAGKLQSNMELWNTVVNSLPFLFFAKDAGKDFRYVMVNEAFERFAGMSRSEIVGRNNAELFAGSGDIEQFQKHDEETMASRGIMNEFMQVVFDGSKVRHCLKTVKRKYIGGDGAKLLLGAAIDITELKTLLDNEQLVNRILKAVAVEPDFEKNLATLMNTIVEQMHCDRIMVIVFDEGKGMRLHREWRGPNIPELGSAGVNAFFRICAGDMEALCRGEQKIYNRFKNSREFCELEACTGNYPMKSIIITPVMAGGRIWGAFSVAFAADWKRVTGGDERALEAVANIVALAMIRSRQLAKIGQAGDERRRIINHINIPVWIYDSAGELISLNTRVAQLAGVSGTELNTVSNRKIFCADFIAAGELPVAEAVRTGKKVIREVTFRGGRFTVTADPVFDADGNLIYVVKSAIPSAGEKALP
ncbi:MAG: PAS domain-containing protein [Victivallaceae bacterium]|nr:PAS domain-containing protein [Victivallaceae bacterium]